MDKKFTNLYLTKKDRFNNKRKNNYIYLSISESLHKNLTFHYFNFVRNLVREKLLNIFFRNIQKKNVVQCIINTLMTIVIILIIIIVIINFFTQTHNWVYPETLIFSLKYQMFKELFVSFLNRGPLCRVPVALDFVACRPWEPYDRPGKTEALPHSLASLPRR